MNDELTLLRASDPAGTVPEMGREELLTSLRGLDFGQPNPTKSWRGHPWLIAGGIAGAFALIAGGGLAYAKIIQQPQTALQINCADPSNWDEFKASGFFTNVIESTSGDPIADCAANYRLQKLSAPDLAAYDVGSPYIAVIPRSWGPPPHGRLLPPGFRIDIRRLALNRALAEIEFSGGIQRCRSTAEATAMVQADLRALNLTGWSVRLAPGHHTADGVITCAWAAVDEQGTPQVYLMTSDPRQNLGGIEPPLGQS